MTTSGAPAPPTDVNPGPRGEQGARLLDLVLETSEIDGFFELKRGRAGGPNLPAPPPT